MMDAFLIKRPWQNIFKLNLYSIIHAFEKRGIFSINIIEEIFSPLLLGADLSIDITMKEFYEFNGIEFHIFSTELNQFETIDFSYKTHPDWRIIDVVYCSCTLPIVFSPFMKEDKWYIDGGILTNYPLYYCLQSGAKSEEILGIRKTTFSKKTYMNEKSTFFDYLMITFNNILEKLLFIDNTIDKKIQYEIVVDDVGVAIQDILSTASSIEKRQQLIQRGVDIFKKQGFTCSSSL
jgi:predicted acylesterase/phospholipase RssA